VGSRTTRVSFRWLRLYHPFGYKKLEAHHSRPVATSRPASCTLKASCNSIPKSTIVALLPSFNCNPCVLSILSFKLRTLSRGLYGTRVICGAELSLSFSATSISAAIAAAVSALLHRSSTSHCPGPLGYCKSITGHGNASYARYLRISQSLF